MTNLDAELNRILGCNGGNDLDNLLDSIPDDDFDITLTDDEISDLDSLSIDDTLR